MPADEDVMADTSRPEGGSLDRRALIKRAAIVGGVAWTAPLIIDSIASPAAAASANCPSAINVSGNGAALVTGSVLVPAGCKVAFTIVGGGGGTGSNSATGGGTSTSLGGEIAAQASGYTLTYFAGGVGAPGSAGTGGTGGNGYGTGGAGGNGGHSGGGGGGGAAALTAPAAGPITTAIEVVAPGGGGSGGKASGGAGASGNTGVPPQAGATGGGTTGGAGATTAAPGGNGSGHNGGVGA